MTAEPPSKRGNRFKNVFTPFVDKLRPYLRPLKRRFRIALYRSLLAIPRGADIYYVFNGRYRSEHYVTLLAKLGHWQATPQTADEDQRRALEFRLRRNVHRLEKGLIMRPRRSLFALDYIGETVDLYRTLRRERLAAQNGQERDATSLEIWAYDVLTSYFAVVGAASEVAAPLARFNDADQCSQETRGYAPQPLVRGDDLPTPGQFAALARTRKSVRWYDGRPVPRAVIDRAVALAGLSPSACNRQPFRFIVFDQPEEAARVGAVPMGTAGFAKNFPCLIVVVGDVGAYFDEKDRHVIYIDAGLASMSLQLALVSEGLGCCCINWPDLAAQDEKIGQFVSLSKTERIVMLLSVGYPLAEGLVPYSAKKEVDLLRSYGTLKEQPAPESQAVASGQRLTGGLPNDKAQS